MSSLAENVPEYRRKLVRLESKTHVAGPLEDEILAFSHLRDARKVSLDVGCEYGNAGTRKTFGHHLQRYGFSGSGGAGDQAMPIGKSERQPRGLFSLPMKIFSSVSAVRIWDVAIVMPRRGLYGRRRRAPVELYSMLQAD
jgi:hypothetical protein